MWGVIIFCVVMKATKLHSLLSASCRTRRAGVVIHSTSKGLRIWGLMVQVPVWVQKPKNGSTNVQVHDKVNVSTQAERVNSSFSCFSVPLRPSEDWRMLTHIGLGGHLYSVYWFKYFLPEIPFQAYPEILLYQLSQCPLVLWRWHKKLTITGGSEGNQESRGTRTKKSKTIEKSIHTSYLPSLPFLVHQFHSKTFLPRFMAEISFVTQENGQNWDWNIFCPNSKFLRIQLTLEQHQGLGVLTSCAVEKLFHV